LSALQELYETTGEVCFYRVNCQVEPWESDCRVLASHLIENDVRGNITFADKARAIVNWCELYEAVHPDEGPLTQRELSKHLGESGFQVSQTSLSRFLYAVEHLLPYFPKAFESGIGREPIERLIRLRTLTEQYWRDTLEVTPLKPDLSFEAVFAEVSGEQDCHREDWAHDIFAAALAHRVAEALGVDAKLVTLDLDSLYHGVPVKITVPVTQGSAGDTDNDGWVFERERRHLAEQAERQREKAEVRVQREAESRASQTAASGGAIEPDATDQRPPAEICSAADLNRWREALCIEANSVAERYGFGALLRSCDLGYGFFVEPPEPPATKDTTISSTGSRDAAALSGIAAWVWWWLCACAQQLDPAHLALIAQRQPTAWLVQLFQGAPQHLPDTNPRAALDVLVGQPDLAMLGEDFLVSESLSDQDFEALQHLFTSCRLLYDAAGRSNVSLWD